MIRWIKNNTKLLAFLFLAIVVSFLFSRAQDDRERIVEATRVVVEDACQGDRANAMIIIKQLDDQIRFVLNSNEPPPPTIEERVEALKAQRARVVVPKCQERLDKLPETK